MLQLGEYLAVFEKEQLTLDDLLLCTEEDLLGLGLPLGPRKRLATYLRDLQLRRTRMSQVIFKKFPTAMRVVLGFVRVYLADLDGFRYKFGRLERIFPIRSS